MSDKATAVAAWEALFRAQVQVMRNLNAEFPGGEISFNEYDVCFNLSTQPGRRSRMRDLTGHLLLTQPSVSRLVDRLAAYPGLAISAGTAYPLLSRLKKSGLITSVWRESPVGPPRKYYRLSPDGENAFAGMAKAWNGMKTEMDDLLGVDAT